MELTAVIDLIREAERLRMSGADKRAFVHLACRRLAGDLYQEALVDSLIEIVLLAVKNKDLIRDFDKSCCSWFKHA